MVSEDQTSNVIVLPARVFVVVCMLYDKVARAVEYTRVSVRHLYVGPRGRYGPHDQGFFLKKMLITQHK